MDIANEVLNNSETYLDINLVHSAEVDYEESNSTRTDISRLVNPIDGYMDKVHDWRAQHSADLVALFANIHDTPGVAKYSVHSKEVMGVEKTVARPEIGFSVSNVLDATSRYTFIHELGHDFGAAHHRDQDTQPDLGVYDYSAGWRDPEEGLCTVMTYDDGSEYDDGNYTWKIPYFSNPNKDYNGVSIGDPEDADNARTIRKTKHMVADYGESDMVQFLSSIPKKSDVLDRSAIPGFTLTPLLLGIITAVEIYQKKR